MARFTLDDFVRAEKNNRTSLCVDSKLIKVITAFTLDGDGFFPYGRFETSVSTTKTYGTVSSVYFPLGQNRLLMVH